MNIRLPRTEKKVIIDEARKTVTTLLLGIDNKSLKYVGVAKCSPEDTFDVDFGTKLAKARCDVKVAKAKIQNASAAYMKASVAADEAQRQYDKMKNYYMDSVDQFDKASAAVVNLIKEIM